MGEGIHCDVWKLLKGRCVSLCVCVHLCVSVCVSGRQCVHECMSLLVYVCVSVSMCVSVFGERKRCKLKAGVEVRCLHMVIPYLVLSVFLVGKKFFKLKKKKLALKEKITRMRKEKRSKKSSLHKTHSFFGLDFVLLLLPPFFNVASAGVPGLC